MSTPVCNAPVLARPLAAACAPARQSGLLSMIFAHLDLWRQRRALSKLDTAALRDIGVTSDEARLEAIRPLWDVPSHWRH